MLNINNKLKKQTKNNQKKQAFDQHTYSAFNINNITETNTDTYLSTVFPTHTNSTCYCKTVCCTLVLYHCVPGGMSHMM